MDVRLGDIPSAAKGFCARHWLLLVPCLLAGAGVGAYRSLTDGSSTLQHSFLVEAGALSDEEWPFFLKEIGRPGNFVWMEDGLAAEMPREAARTLRSQTTVSDCPDPSSFQYPFSAPPPEGHSPPGKLVLFQTTVPYLFEVDVSELFPAFLRRVVAPSIWKCKAVRRVSALRSHAEDARMDELALFFSFLMCELEKFAFLPLVASEKVAQIGTVIVAGGMPALPGHIARSSPAEPDAFSQLRRGVFEAVEAARKLAVGRIGKASQELRAGMAEAVDLAASETGGLLDQFLLLADDRLDILLKRRTAQVSGSLRILAGWLLAGAFAGVSLGLLGDYAGFRKRIRQAGRPNRGGKQT